MDIHAMSRFMKRDVFFPPLNKIIGPIDEFLKLSNRFVGQVHLKGAARDDTKREPRGKMTQRQRVQRYRGLFCCPLFAKACGDKLGQKATLAMLEEQKLGQITKSFLRHTGLILLSGRKDGAAD